jgi:hypothetical protein
MGHGTFNTFYKKFYDNPEDLKRKRARLFPAFKTKKVIEEDVTSNIFLGCLVGILEFKKMFFQEINIKLRSSSEVHAYTQIDFEENNKSNYDTPDGLLVITEGRDEPIVTWVALLEFKTAGSLNKDQILKYSEIAKKNHYSFDALITISNDLVSTPLHNIFGFRSTKKLMYFHFSWVRIQSMLQYVIQEGIKDDDQKYLAEQLLLYLKEHKDVQYFDKMNKDWESQVKTIQKSKSITGSDKDILTEIASDWLQEEQDLCFKVRSEHEKEITVKLSRKEQDSINNRIDTIKKDIQKNKFLKSTYCIKPDTSGKSPLSVIKNRNLEINNIIDINKRTQLVSAEIFNPKFEGAFLYTKIKNFVKPIVSIEPAKTDSINIKFYITGKQACIIDEPICNYKKYLDRDNFPELFKELEIDLRETTIRKIEIEYFVDVSSTFYHRKNFIQTLEENFIIFFTQIIKPFSK